MTDTGVFEFTDGFQTIAVMRGGPRGLEPERAAALLRQRLQFDWSLRRGLAGWVRSAAWYPGLGDDDQLVASVVGEVLAGWIRIHERGSRAPPTVARRQPRSPLDPLDPPPPPPPIQLEPAPPVPAAPLVELRVVEHLAIGDINFSTDRAVMLPGPSSEAELVGDRTDGIASIAGVLAHLRRIDEPRLVMAAGHTDTAGSFAHNIELSLQRAESVKLVCDGDAEGFASHAEAHAEVADAQEILRWITQTFAWPCDPGPVDNDDGPKTSAARSQFRQRFSAEYARDPGSAPAFQRADWLAFFRLYERDLAARLGVTATELASVRARLVWANPPTLGCGEYWPETRGNQAPFARADRRVELLCFPPSDVPAGAGEPPGASIYDDPRYLWRPIAAGPGPRPFSLGLCFELALPADRILGDPDDANSEALAVWLRGGSYDLRHCVADAQRRGPYLLFQFEGIVPGAAYRATLERDDAEPIVLFDGASLDSYIAQIDPSGDPDAQPNAIDIQIPAAPEPREPGGTYEYSAPPPDPDDINED